MLFFFFFLGKAVVRPVRFFKKNEKSLRLLFGLLGQENRLDVGQNAALGDRHSGKELVQLFVVPDRQLQMSGNDPGLLVVSGGVSCQLENFGGQIFHDGGEVDGSSGTDAFGVVSFTEETMDPADGELKTGTARTGLRLSLDFSSLSTS